MLTDSNICIILAENHNHTTVHASQRGDLHGIANTKSYKRHAALKICCLPEVFLLWLVSSNPPTNSIQ